MKLSTMSSILIAGLLILNPGLGFAKDKVVNEKTQTAKSNSQKKTEEIRKEITSEAITAINQTVSALRYLDKKKTKDALKSLEKATGKLEIILAREPSLSLAPVDVSSRVFETITTPKQVKQLRDDAEDYLEDGRVQDARRLLENLASEIVISTTSIPLATYPQAIKRAVALIDKKKIDDSKVVLQTALNTLVVSEIIIPLPIMRAEEFLKDAEKLTEKKARSEQENKELKELLDYASEEIELAEAFGYGTKKELKNFEKQLKEIRKKTEDGKSGTGFFAKIKKTMKSMVGSSQKDK